MGAQSIDRRAGALSGRTGDPRTGSAPKRGVARHFAAVPALLVLALPKCPLCAAAYLGVAGSLLDGRGARFAWGAPIACASMVAVLVVLGIQARRRGDVRPVLLGLCATIVALAGKFAAGGALVASVGAAMLVGACAWSASNKGSNGRRCAAACSERGRDHESKHS